MPDELTMLNTSDCAGAYFIPEIVDTDKLVITKLDGTKVKCNSNYLLCRYIYNDYTNLNIKLIDKYDLDLKIFYEELPNLDNIILEIPMDKIELIVNKAGQIVENSYEKKEYLFNMENVEQFIKVCTERIIENIKEIGE